MRVRAARYNIIQQLTRSVRSSLALLLLLLLYTCALCNERAHPFIYLFFLMINQLSAILNLVAVAAVAGFNRTNETGMYRLCVCVCVRFLMKLQTVF